MPLFPRSLQPHSLIRHAGNYQHLWSEKQSHHILGIWAYVIVRAGTVHNRLFLTGATDCKSQGRQKRKMDMKWKKRGRAKTCEAEVKLPWTEWNLHCFLTSSKSAASTMPLSCMGALIAGLSSRSWWSYSRSPGNGGVALVSAPVVQEQQINDNMYDVQQWPPKCKEEYSRCFISAFPIWWEKSLMTHVNSDLIMGGNSEKYGSSWANLTQYKLPQSIFSQYGIRIYLF